MGKVLTIIVASLSLMACSKTTKIINETATPLTTPTIVTTEETITYEPSAPADENDTELTGENEQVAYKEGCFESLHNDLTSEYAEGFQSFDKKALLDLYGDGETEYFTDGIGFISQETGSYNQFIALEDLDAETGADFVSNITRTITNDPSIENVEYETYKAGNVTVICIGDQDFRVKTQEMVSNIYGQTETVLFE